MQINPSTLSFKSERAIFQQQDKPVFVQRTLIITNTNNSEAEKVTLVSSNFDSTGLSKSLSSEYVSFTENNFTLQPLESKQIVVKIDVSSLEIGSYRGYIVTTLEGSESTTTVCDLFITQSSWVNYSILSILFVIVFIAYWLLLKKNSNTLFPIISFFLVFIGLVLLLLTVPFGDMINTILVTIVVSPIIAFLISLLTTKRDFTKSIDDTTHAYRKTMIENESEMLGRLMGELSTHYAEFSASDWPYPQKLMDKVWSDSYKTKLISDTHITLLAQYYYYVPIYNEVIESIGKIGKCQPTKLDTQKENFNQIKASYQAAETVLYNALMYDLGLLQQSYLNRPNVQFPLHTQKTFQEALVRYGILRKGEKIHKKIYFKQNPGIFNRETVRDFGLSYRQMESDLNSFKKEIARALKEIENKKNTTDDFLLNP